MAKILDGKKLSLSLGQALENKIKKLPGKPKLVIIQAGNDERSNVYIRNKVAFGERVGAIVEHKKYPESVSEKTITDYIENLNKNKSVHGIIVQLPVPKHLDPDKITEAIEPKKDVDALTATNIRSLFYNVDTFLPATTKGILTILDHYKIEPKGKRVVIVGDSRLVGRPTALALLNRLATVTVCHNKTKDLASETKQADILITAVGQPRLITTKHVSKGQIVLDIGISVDKKGHISGDVDYEKVSKIVKMITPVPGGVGPMTVYSLFDNLLKAYLLNSSKR